MIEERSDAFILRQAVAVLRRRTKKPNGWWFKVLTKTLLDTADKLEKQDSQEKQGL
jgi:hypothetical protein